jgi:hypothetical protein
MKAGSTAGSVKRNGYVAIKIDGVLYKAHRLAWYLGTGVWPAPEIEIDHINRVKGDNRLCNLRLVTRIGNQANTERTRVAKPKPPKPEGPRKIGRGYERPAPMPVEKLRALLIYDPATGILRWARDCGGKDGKRIKAGTPTGCKGVYGYLLVRLPQGLYPAHRLIWFLVTGEWPPSGMVIDHINGVRHDNRWANLRLATEGQNRINSPASRRGSTGYRGVTRCRGKFRAQIKINGKLKTFPQRATAEEAYSDYCEAARVHHGAFARLA